MHWNLIVLEALPQFDSFRTTLNHLNKSDLYNEIKSESRFPLGSTIEFLQLRFRLDRNRNIRLKYIRYI
jgi:hypothetical protein